MIPERFTKFKEARAAHSEPEARRFIARVYWAGLIIFFALVCVASIGYGVWEFLRPLEASTGDVQVGAGNATLLNRTDLQAVLNGFDARNERFEERRGAPVLRDPS